MQKIKLSILLLLLNFHILSAAEDAYDLPKVVAVQDRAYSVRKEITPHLGVLPLDAFNKSLLAGVSFTYSWNPAWSWEVINASAAMNQVTDLRNQLVNNFKVEPKGVLDYPTGMYTSQILYSPMYGKYLMFNDKVVHNELSLGLTGGVITYKVEGAVPVVGPGIVSRYYINEDSSIKVDARLLYQVDSNQSSSYALYFTIGYSIHLDSSKGKP